MHNNVSYIFINLQIANEELPLYFTIESKVSSSQLQISTRILDFGSIYRGQFATLPLTVVNNSLLPQKIAFLKSPTEISIMPNGGMALLLPRESIVFNISYSPSSHFDSGALHLDLHSSVNDVYKIHVKGCAVPCPLHLSTSALDYRSMHPGARTVRSLLVTNTSQETLSFEIMFPPSKDSWITVSPSICSQLAPEQSCRVEVTFAPPHNALEIDPEDIFRMDDSPKDSCFNSIEASVSWLTARSVYFGTLKVAKRRTLTLHQDNVEEERKDESFSDRLLENSPVICEEDLPQESERGVLGNWRLPIFISSQGEKGAAGVHFNPIILTVDTMVTPPAVVADVSEMDFGDVAIGARVLQRVKLTNTSTSELKTFSSRPLNAAGPFSMINALRPIAAGQTVTLIVECFPRCGGLMEDELCLVSSSGLTDGCDGQEIRIPILCRSIVPSIEIKGAQMLQTDGVEALLDYKHVVASEVITKKLELVNSSAFVVTVTIKRRSLLKASSSQQTALVQRTKAGFPLFSFTPETVLLQAGEKAEVICVFRPDESNLSPFREDVIFYAGDSTEVLSLALVGRVWDRQVILTAALPRDELFISESVMGDAWRSLKKEEIKLLTGVELAPLPAIILQFADLFGAVNRVTEQTNGAAVSLDGKGKKVAGDGSKQQVKKILVSSLKMLDGRGGSATAGSFEVIQSKNLKGTVSNL